MQRSTSHGRGISSDRGPAPPPSRDPRRARTYSNYANDSSSSARGRDDDPRDWSRTRDRSRERDDFRMRDRSRARDDFRMRDDTRARDDTASDNARGLKSSNALPHPPHSRDLPAALSTALSTAISAAVEAGLAKIKRESLQLNFKAAQARYESAQRTALQFPIISEQAQQEKKKIELRYEAARQEANDSTAAEQSAADAFLQVILDVVDKPSNNRGVPSDQVGVYRQEMAGLRSQQMKDYEQLRTQLRKLQDVEDNQTQQRSKIKDVELMSTKLHDDLVTENQKLRQALNDLQQQIEPMKEATRHLQSMQASGSDTFGSRATQLRKELHEEINLLRGKFNDYERRFDDHDKLRKSSHLKLENLNGEITTLSSRTKTVQEDFSRNEADMATLKADLAAVKADLADARVSSEDAKDTIKRHEQEFTKAKGVLSSVEVKSQALDQSVKQLTENSESLRASISHLGEQYSNSPTDVHFRKVSGFITDKLSEFENRRDAANNLRDTLISDEIKKLEDLMTEQRLDINDIRHGQQQATNYSKHEELEKRVEDDHKRIEKHELMVQSLSHRFDNLTSEELTRQMVGVLAPTLPRFEQGLTHIERRVRDLLALVEQSQLKADNDAATKTKMVQSLQDNLDEMKLKLASDHESLAVGFRKASDELKDQIKALESSNARSEVAHETPRDSVNDKIRALETIVGDMKAEIEELRRESSRPMTARTTPDSTAWPTVHLNGKAYAFSNIKKDRAKDGATKSRGTADFPSDIDRNILEESDPDDLSVDPEAVRVEILQRFKKPNLNPNGGTAAASKSPRGSHPSAKRKRSESLDDLDLSVRPEYSRPTRNPARSRERRS